MTPDDLLAFQQELGIPKAAPMARHLGVHRMTYDDWTKGRARIPYTLALYVQTWRELQKLRAQLAAFAAGLPEATR